MRNVLNHPTPDDQVCPHALVWARTSLNSNVMILAWSEAVAETARRFP